MTDIKVTQADRDETQVYADFYSESDSYSLACHQRLAEAFARHRIEAQRPLLEALEELLAGVDCLIPLEPWDEEGPVTKKAREAIKQAKGE